MKRTHIIIVTMVLLVSILTGCNKAEKEDNNSEEKANEIIEKGINSLEVEDYEEARGFFDIAIEEYPGTSTSLAKKMAEKYIQIRNDLEDTIINKDISDGYDTFGVEDFYDIEKINKNFNTFNMNYPEYSESNIVKNLDKEIEELSNKAVDFEMKLLFYNLSICEPDMAKEVLKEFVENHEEYSSSEQLKVYSDIKKDIKAYSMGGNAEIDVKYKLEDDLDNVEENTDYDKSEEKEYLKDKELSEREDQWTKETVIDIYEKVFKNDIVWDNYRRDLWSVLEEETYDNIITLHFSNISGAGGSYTQFIKGDGNIEIIEFDGNASFPHNPYAIYTIESENYTIIKMEEL